MNFNLTDEQKSLQKLVQEFTLKEVTPVAPKYDHEGEFPWDLFNKVVEMGLHCMPAPEEYDGPGSAGTADRVKSNFNSSFTNSPTPATTT
jgi:alkylation response protein AidB-like acyl-CoA dehydrogenase